MASREREKWEVIERVKRLGISEDDALALRRISMTLRRWFEQECGDSTNYASFSIERDESTGLPFKVTRYHSPDMQKYDTRVVITDRETGAKKRLAKIMKGYPTLGYYIQGDCRGASLYLLRPGDVPEGQSADAYYSRGIAVY